MTSSAAMGSPSAMEPSATGPASASRPRWDTVGDCLRHTARTAPDRGLCIYTRKRSGELVTYPEVLRRSEVFARRLLAQGVTPGTLVGLVIPTSVDFFVAFFGCQLARAAAVPLSLPMRVGSSRDRGARRLLRILQEIDLHLLVDGHDLDLESLGLPDLRVLRVSERDAEACSEALPAALPEAQPDDLGLVQFTSGSLSQPKGVCLTQGNVSYNIQTIVDAVGMNVRDTIDLWIPLYHDMGLMGSLTAIASQGNLRLCGPLNFLIDPLGWLLRFSRRRSTINPSPHFFFRMLIEAYDPERAAELDLSLWRVAFNGAEPILAEDVDRFQELYGPHGFRRETLYPVYGLAESTLAALFPPYGTAPVTVAGEEVFPPSTDAWLRAKRFVSVGGPIEGHEARIDPCPESEAQLELPAQIGELKIRGPSVTTGYLHRPEETAELLDEDGWFSTRDLAFHHDGRYYICGRLKEIIIVRGENYFPEDFEQLVDRLRPSTPFPVVGRAAFPRAGAEGEEVALAVEVKGAPEEADRERFLEALRAASSERFGFEPVVLFLAPRSIPRTTSGKLQRLLLAQRLESGELIPLDVSTGET